MRNRTEEDSTFEDLLRGLEPRFRSVLARFRIPAQDAEDLLQQTLLTYLRKRDAVHEPEAWLVGTLRNGCLKYWRARRRRVYTAVDGALLEEMAASPAVQERADLRRDLSNAVGRLRPRCRSILRLRYGLGCAPRETAQRLGFRESSIYKLVERCLAALSTQLLQSPKSRAC